MVSRENHVTSADHVTGEDHVVEREVLRLEEPGNLDYPVSEDSGEFCSQVVGKNCFNLFSHIHYSAFSNF